MLRKKKAESRTPQLFSLNQDIVYCAQEGKGGLKYVNFQIAELILRLPLATIQVIKSTILIFYF